MFLLYINYPQNNHIFLLSVSNIQHSIQIPTIHLLKKLMGQDPQYSLIEKAFGHPTKIFVSVNLCPICDMDYSEAFYIGGWMYNIFEFIFILIFIWALSEQCPWVEIERVCISNWPEARSIATLSRSEFEPRPGSYRVRHSLVRPQRLPGRLLAWRTFWQSWLRVQGTLRWQTILGQWPGPARDLRPQACPVARSWKRKGKVINLIFPPTG